MGAKAHGRRREGRRIRKTRRLARAAAAAFVTLGAATESASLQIEAFGAALASMASYAVPLAGPYASAEGRVPYPTHSGVKAATSPLKGLSVNFADVDEFHGVPERYDSSSQQT